MATASTPRFAVTTFERVFDVAPNRDVVSLQRLSDSLQRFLVKPETRTKTERAERRIQTAWRAFQVGEHRAGRAWTRLSKAARQAEQAGEDPLGAARRERDQMVSEAQSDPKRDLRLWSPAHYPPDSRRSGENVLHLSCVVLDYDSGLPVAEAATSWQDYFHIVHTTWSHTPDKPKFRLILPLAEPVRPVDWRTVYEWAEEQAAGAADPTGRSLGTTFALPAIADEAVARVAFARPGPLLDARVEGLIDEAAEPPEEGVEPHGPNHFRIPIPGHRAVRGAPPGPAELTGNGAAGAQEDDPWDDASFPWD
ncbi:MAG: hypothetical protein MPN21_24980 [Thermoanaerobaculia bacterium]|nr:hypothetical protein [Thermoanaerobaculia bacterium]